MIVFIVLLVIVLFWAIRGYMRHKDALELLSKAREDKEYLKIMKEASLVQNEVEDAMDELLTGEKKNED